MDGARGSPVQLVASAGIDRGPFELFLIHEAQLLDERRFRDWMALFAEDGTYWVPAVPNQESPFNQASLFYDDRELMKTRVDRLEHPRIHVQTPPSRTAHLVGNMVVEQADEPAGEYRRRLDFHHGRVSRRPAARLRRPPASSAAPRRRKLPHRPEARRPDQLRQRVRSDGRADLTTIPLATIADSDFATGAQRVVSACTNFVYSSGDINFVSMASSASRS